MTAVTLPPSGVATSPIAKARGAAGRGVALRVERVERFRGRVREAVGAEIRTGARTGADISTAAAIAPAQSSSPTSVTAAGRCAGVVEGNTASATAAALAAGSEPPTRVVLPVAKEG